MSSEQIDEETEAFFVSDEEAGERLDKILAARFSGAGSRTYFQSLIDEGKVLLNGAPVKKRIKPKAGDEVEVEFILSPDLTLKAEAIPLKVIFEDAAMVVVDKPAGMVVHPAVGHWTGTFVNALLHHCGGTIGSVCDSLRPGIVHRIDKETSGLLVAAKTSAAQTRLIEQFAGRSVYKEYLAICIGNPGAGTVEAPIGRHPHNRKLMAVVESGRAATTHFRTLAFNGTLSLVSVVIATGRTHQIRVHMKHRGTPVLGDPAYGTPSFNAKMGLERQMLHAHRLRLSHPVSGEILEFETPPPMDMLSVIRKAFGKEVV